MTQPSGVSLGGVRIRDVRDPSDPVLPRAYTDILVPAFPVEQLVSHAELVAGLRNGTAFVAVARDGDGPVGMMVAEPCPRASVLLLSYLAVRPDARGRGVGSALLRDPLPRWRDLCGAGAVVAEVEDPRFHPAGRYGDPTARLRFYQRAGYGLLPTPFVQPRVAPGQRRVDGMLLAVAPDDRPVSAHSLRSFVTGYFESAEGPGVHDDPVFNALLASAERSGPDLVPVPADRYASITALNVPAELLRRDYPATATAVRLLATDDRAGTLLDAAWSRILTRLADGEALPRPRFEVVVELLDTISDAGLLHVSAEPADATVLSWWFADEEHPWAGWWRRDPPLWTDGGPPASLLVSTVRRLPPLPRITVILCDVLGMPSVRAAAVTGQSERDFRELVAVTWSEVIALLDRGLAELDRSLEEEVDDGGLPEL